MSWSLLLTKKLGFAPYRGPVADAIQTPVLRDLAEVWYERLLAGPMATIDLILYFTANETGVPSVDPQTERQAARALVTNILNAFGFDPNSVSGRLASYINQLYGNMDSVDDMRPGSTFLSQLNDAPETTLPSARYAIYGSEKLYSYVRLYSSFQEKNQTGDPMEDSSKMTQYYVAGGFWLYISIWHAYTGLQYQVEADDVGSGDPNYFYYQELSTLHFYAARQWSIGFFNFAILMPAEWKANITESLSVSDLQQLNLGAIQADDALLAKDTQAPTFFNTVGDGIDRRLDADGANHLEETVHPSVRERLEEVFNNPDVLIDQVGDEGGGGIEPPDSCDDDPEACPSGN